MSPLEEKTLSIYCPFPGGGGGVNNHYVEKIWRTLVKPNFLNNIYYHKKYYAGDPVNIRILSLIITTKKG